jgi:hypothetical protein
MLQNFGGYFQYVISNNPEGAGGGFYVSAESAAKISPTASGVSLYQVGFNAALVARTGSETKPVSISTYLCIVY